MSLPTTLIPFHNLNFIDDIPSLHDVEQRFRAFLLSLRKDKRKGEDQDEEWVLPRLERADRQMIDRRAKRLLERKHSSTGMYHLKEDMRVRLLPLRGGLPVSSVSSEHHADEIAAALHEEMPWMAQATEAVWHGLRASARDGLPGLRFPPLILVGAPGIGKSFWARRLAQLLTVPHLKIDATGEPATFALVGLQKGWGSASAGRLMQTILQEQHAGPMVIIDEVEKAGEVTSSKGGNHTLTDAMLPLLERMTAASWTCPYFQITCDMSWVNYVMTANSREGLSDALQSRCVVLDMPDLTAAQLCAFAEREAKRRALPEPAREALLEVFDRVLTQQRSLSLRTVSRLLDRAEALTRRPVLS